MIRENERGDDVTDTPGAWCNTDRISPGSRVTAIIRDDAPMIHCGDSPSYRTVVFHLTAEQERALLLHATSQSGMQVHHEQLSRLILERVDDEDVVAG